MNRQTRHIVVPITIGIVVAATVLAGGWWLSQDGDERPAGSPPTATPSVSVSTPPDTGEPTPSTTAPQVGTWQRLPAAPIPGMSPYDLGGAWTGQEFLVTGLLYEQKQGRPTIRHVGAAYNPSTATWRTLPPMPGVAEVREGGYLYVWTGRELLAGGQGLHAAYNPATNRWRPVSSRIGYGSTGGTVVVWTGRQLLLWGGGCCGEESDAGMAYTPATDSWQRLPQAPLAGRHTTGVWTGTEMVVVGGEARGRIFRDAAAYNPATRSWRRLPPMPAPRTGASATWTETEILVVGGGGPRGGYTDGVAYNPATNRWRRLPSMGVGRTGHTAVWTGDQLLVWGARTAPPYGLAYDPATNQWSELPISPLRGRTGHLAVWTGSQMLIWGGSSARASDPDTRFADGAAYTPPGS
jgi:N-acetylneuraminic acid mutarotase